MSLNKKILNIMSVSVSAITAIFQFVMGNVVSGVVFLLATFCFVMGYRQKVLQGKQNSGS